MTILERAAAYEDYIISMRRHFHQHAEISLHEFETSKRVKAELDAMGIPAEIVADTGVLGEITGAFPGPTVALRGDMDALPIEEETGLAYASQNHGAMHACGHDCHTAMLLGAARILNDIRDQLHGRVRLIFEPAEEVAKGALKMIGAGAMEGVDTVFGIHVWSDLEAGTVSLEAGPRMASADFFTIEVKGRSCHGSMPNQGIDAIAVGSAMVQNLQTALVREFSPLEPVVISVCEFKAGSCHNQIAGSAFMSGTTRAFSREVRAALPEVMERILQQTAALYGAQVDLHYEMGSSPVFNDEGCSKIAAAAAEQILGREQIVRKEKSPGGENFSEYQMLKPGVFAFLGVRNPALNAVYAQHSCHYRVDESVLHKGSALEVQYVLEYMNQK